MIQKVASNLILRKVHLLIHLVLQSLLKLVSLFNLSIFDGMDLKINKIYKDGIQFSSMYGELDLVGETVNFENNPIKVITPSSNFVLSGVADLKNSKIKSTLVATLPVKDIFPGLLVRWRSSNGSWCLFSN